MAYSSLAYRGFRSSTTDGSTHTFSACDLGTASDGRAILVAVAQDAVSASTTIYGDPGAAVTINGVYAKLVAVGYNANDVCIAAYIARVPTGTSGDIVVKINKSVATCNIAWYSFNPSSLTPLDWSTSNALLASGNSYNLSTADVAVTNGGVIFSFTALSYPSSAYTGTTAAIYNGVDTPVVDLTATAGTAEYLSLSTWHAVTTETVGTNDPGFDGSQLQYAVTLGISFGVEEPPIVNSDYNGFAYLGTKIDTSNSTSITFSNVELNTANTNRAILLHVCKTFAGSTDPNLSATIGGVSATKLLNDVNTTYGSGHSVFVARVPTGSTGDIVISSTVALTNCTIFWYSFNPVSLTPVDTVTNSGVANATSPTKVNDLATTDGGIAFLLGRNSAVSSALYYNGIDTPTQSYIGAPVGGSYFQNATGAYVRTTETSTLNDFGINSAIASYMFAGVSFGVAVSAGPYYVSASDTMSVSSTSTRTLSAPKTLTDTVGIKYRFPIEAAMTEFLALADVGGPEVFGVSDDAFIIADAYVVSRRAVLTDVAMFGEALTAAPRFGPTIAEVLQFVENVNLGRTVGLTDTTVMGSTAAPGSRRSVTVADPAFLIGDTPVNAAAYRTTLADMTGIMAQLDHGYGIALTDVPALSDTALNAVRPLPVITDRVTFAEALARSQKFVPNLIQDVQIGDVFTPGIPRSISDTVTLSSSLLTSHATRVLERLRFAEVALPRLTYRMTVQQIVSIYDTFNNFFGGAVSDTFATGDAITSQFKLRLPLADTVAFTDTLSKHFVIRIVTAESVRINKTQALKLLFKPTLAETVEISAAYLSPNENFVTWVVNSRTSAVSEYTNYDFNSFAAVGNTYLAAKSDGLYQLNGDTDAGSSIVAQLRTALLQMNGSRYSALHAVYLGMRSNGTYQLKIIDGAGNERMYECLVQNMETTKIRVGKGLRARYYAFELQNTDGNDFDLDTLEIVPILAGRRV